MKRKKTLIKIGIMMIFALLISIFAGIAWFTMNKEVGTGGMSISTATMPFELKTVGYYGYYDDWLDSGVDRLAENLAIAGLPPSGANGELTTLGNTIQWLVSDDYNANNYVTSTTLDEDKGIRPGTRGRLDFWVVPKEQAEINISFKINVIPYKVVYEKDTNGDYVFSSGSLLPNELPPESIEDDNEYAEVKNYIRTHIMFFKKRVKHGSGTSEYYSYSGLIPLDEDFELVYDSESGTYTGTLVFEENEGELQDELFSIYWVWPETLAEALLSEINQNPGRHAVCDTDEIRTLFKEDPSCFLKDYDKDRDVAGTDNSAITESTIINHYSKLSLEYNNADQDIGDEIGYVLLQLSAE